MTSEEIQALKGEAWAAGWLHCYNQEHERPVYAPLPAWLAHFMPLYNPHHRTATDKRVQVIACGTASPTAIDRTRKQLVQFLEMDEYLHSHRLALETP